MKLSHNKKRNTAFIYEMLVKELAKASMNGDATKKNLIVSVIREAFSSKGLMKRELDIYKSFDSVQDLEPSVVEKVLVESKKQFSNLDRKKIFDEQTKVISKINKSLGPEVWNTFVTDFKKVATINQVLKQDISPKKQVMLEARLLDSLVKKKVEKKPFPNINKLAMKSFIENFNTEYAETLVENQKVLLNKYISSYEDSGVALKAYLYEEIDRIKEEFTHYTEQNENQTSEKVHKLLERMSGYSKRKVDKDFVVEIMRMQSIVEELKL